MLHTQIQLQNMNTIFVPTCTHNYNTLQNGYLFIELVGYKHAFFVKSKLIIVEMEKHIVEQVAWK